MIEHLLERNVIELSGLEAVLCVLVLQWLIHTITKEKTTDLQRRLENLEFDWEDRISNLEADQASLRFTSE